MASGVGDHLSSSAPLLGSGVCCVDEAFACTARWFMAVFSDLFCPSLARSGDADNAVDTCRFLEPCTERSLYIAGSWARCDETPRTGSDTDGCEPPNLKPAPRERSITAGLSRSERTARTAALPLDIGPALIVILLLSLGLWAIISGL